MSIDGKRRERTKGEGFTNGSRTATSAEIDFRFDLLRRDSVRPRTRFELGEKLGRNERVVL